MAADLSYAGKRVVVSGCFSGMGEATARSLLELGAEVHGLDYKDTNLNLASFTKVDLRDPASIDAAAASIGGKIDALFNCAGLPQTFPAIEVMKVNYMGTRRMTEQLLPYMGEGSAIVSISSNGGLGWSQRIPLLIQVLQIDGFEAAVKWTEEHSSDVAEGYALSKELIILWTMMMGVPFIKRGIRINCTQPGPTQTPMMKDFETATPAGVLTGAMQPINRRSTPQEQANALIFLNSDLATYINGVSLPIDGGFMGGLATGQIDITAMMAAAAG
ncbi:3-alpha-hydroxysteroid dehydrogenase [Acidocella aquatica]|uniref:3-alpha-hydroxysteroid dehydrogenase n=1 Tax=Acidocella aquatica TaxID=1922313 RepID=A0ABQ6A3P2_9PROT|nr:coniferyl-alcohol dehydrogenase [Acidocella aquatica]GLR67105.1 3-alpha-hydroxysteroid dehydrogenase [Acidocella aquatica]